MRKQRFPFRPQLEVFEDRLCPSATVQLPISAFLSQQGTTSMFTPPVRDQIGSTNSIYNPGTTSSDPNRFLLVDYTGQAASYLLQNGINLHTKVTGFVTETPIGTTGLMEVSVNLEAANALTWVANISGLNPNAPGAVNAAPLELGYRAQDLAANPNLKPALSDVHFQITFQELTGAPLPDLVQALPLGNGPPGFSLESINFQSWGTGVLDAGTTVGVPGKTALVTTSQIGDFTQPHLPGTLPDGVFQEPINIVPLPSSNPAIAYLNGSLFITDLSNGNDNISVSPAAHGGVTVSSNLGSGTFPSVNTVVVSLGNGNSNVEIGQLPGARVNVAALDGNNNITIGIDDANSGPGDRRHTITIGNEDEVVVSVGGGNNTIRTGTVGLAQQIFVSGNGNNTITAGLGDTVVLASGNGNNTINAAGRNDFIEMLGNGNNHISDAGVNDLVWLGGDGNNYIDNQGEGSFTNFLAQEQPFYEKLTVVSVSSTGVIGYVGNSPQLGQVTAVLNPDNTFIKTTANGDKIFGYVTHATATTGTITTTGGTGQWKGLTGESSYVISTDPTSGATTVAIVGFIEFPPKGATQIIPFNINGGGTAPDGLPVFPGGTAPHNATGTATLLGNYSGGGTFELLTLDPATLTGTFQGVFVFVAANGDRLAVTYGAAVGNPGKFTLTPMANGMVVATFVAEFIPNPALSTGRFAQVSGGGFLMVATSAPFELGPNMLGFTAPFAYTWVGQGLLEFSNGR